MQDDPNDLTPAQHELERALRSVHLAPPTAARIDPTAAALGALAAYRRSARRRLRAWQSAAVVLFGVGAATRLVPVAHGPASPPVHDTLPPTLAVDAGPAAPVRPLPVQSLFVVQRAVRDRGIDGLPAPQLPAVHAVRIGNTL